LRTFCIQHLIIMHDAPQGAACRLLQRCVAPVRKRGLQNEVNASILQEGMQTLGTPVQRENPKQVARQLPQTLRCSAHIVLSRASVCVRCRMDDQLNEAGCCRERQPPSHNLPILPRCR